MLSRKNLIRIVINSLIGLILIVLWVKLVDVEAVLHEISQVNPLTVLPFVFFFVLSNFFRSLRLKILLSSYNINLLNVLKLNYLGQLLSFTIPLRVGEIAKGVYLSSQYKIPFSKTVIWILLDRFLDFWLVLVLALILLAFIPTNLPANFSPILIGLVILFTIATVLVIYYADFMKYLIRIFSKLLVVKGLKRIFIKITEYIVDTTSFLKRGVGETLALLLLTLAALVSDGLTWYAIFLIFEPSLEYLPIFLGSLLSSLTYLIPAAPGYVGSAEASTLAVFSYGLGIDTLITSATAVLYHIAILITILFFGLIALYSLKFDLSSVWNKLKKNE